MHSYKTLLVLVAFLCLIAGPSSAESSSQVRARSDLFGKIIQRIDYSSDLPLNRLHYDPYIGIKPGEALTRTGVKRAIQFLYECGRFSAVSADAMPSGDSVDITFRLRHNYYFNRFSLVGNFDLKGRSLSECVSLPIGQRFTEEKLEEARQAVLRYMKEKGYFLGQIRARTAVEEKSRQVDTIFEAQPGKLAAVRSVKVSGIPPYDVEKVLRQFGFRTGQRYDRSRVNSRLDNLRRQFMKRGYLAAAAQVEELFDAASNAVDLILTVSNFGKMKVIVDGYKIDKDQLRRLLPVLTGEGIDREILEEGLDNLKEYLHNQGYSEADVEIRESVDKDGVRVFQYKIVPNHKAMVSFVGFEGNRAIPDREMMAALQIQPRTFSPGTPYSAALLKEDVNSLKSLYASRGYLSAKITPRVDPIGKGRKVSIAYLCEEGPLSRVRSLEISGNSALTTASLMTRIRLAPGKPYSPVLAEQDRQFLLAAYNDSGYLWAQIAVRVGSPDQAHSYPVEFQIQEGIQTVVERILVLGNEKTRSSVIRKKIRLRENEPLSLGKMLQTQQALYGLGVFDQVRVAQRNTDAAVPFQDIIVRLQESKRFTVRYGLGYQEREKVRGTLEFTHVNLFGMARRAHIRLRGSSIEQQALLGFQQPQFRDVPIDSYLTFSAGHKKEISFDSRRFSASYQFSHPFAEHSWGMLRYNFRNVRILNPRIPESSLGREDSPRNFSTFSAAFVNDSRDEFLDPTKGFFSSTDFGVTPRLLSSQSFVTFFSQNSYYRRLPKSLQLAASVRFGAGHSLEKGPDLPISERFFAGGSSSIRGFDTDYAGPLDPSTNKPLGGNALFVGSAEIRFPVFRFIHLAGFYDTGNVFRTLSTLSMNDFCHTLGGGLRIKTPFGPLRADYGYNINLSSDLRRRGLNPGHLFITVGPPF